MRLKPLKSLALILLVAAAGIGYLAFTHLKGGTGTNPQLIVAEPTSFAPTQTQTAPAATENKVVPITTAGPVENIIVPPLADALSRVTKKPFGLYVRPGASPVSPERFQGYHVGVDFETTAAEQDADVAVDAICRGPLLLKEWASGYGGVAVQACRLGAQDVTVVYGHLRLSSISAALNQELESGQRLGVLGRGYSTETDGERKHLHLGIHKGTAINIKGYVQSQTEVDQWVDVRTLLGK